MDLKVERVTSADAKLRAAEFGLMYNPIEVWIMEIDIDSMSYDELVELNHKIVEKLKFLDSMHTHKKMLQFSPGDQVCFEPSGRGKQFGTLVKYNQKTVTVITESGQKWNVSPH